MNRLELLKAHGKPLPKEVWERAMDGLAQSTPMFANLLRKINHEGLGESDAEEYTAYMELAINAMHYVTEFARDKCLIITIKDLEKGG